MANNVIIGVPGPQGPPGQNASQPILAFAHTTRYYRFAVDYNFTATGTYSVDGTVTEHVNTAKRAGASKERFVSLIVLAGVEAERGGQMAWRVRSARGAAGGSARSDARSGCSRAPLARPG